MLDLFRIKSSVSSLFSDSSISTGSSNSEMSLFPNSIQTCRSDSPNSETSSHSAESVSTHSTCRYSPNSETSGHSAESVSTHTEQFMQTINVLHSVLQYQSAPIVENDALELQAKYHRSAAEKELTKMKILLHNTNVSPHPTKGGTGYSLVNSNYSVKTFQKLDPLKTIFYTSAILNLTGKENLRMNLDSNGLKSTIGNMVSV
ncbi:hypothetical protein V9T40_006394 [Parthenolecanium corni]|uniref:Uncharacterized protein n=1 Tax=Parthenolecanium corni TaxID=536013 RepID=A0AAN9Y5H4_9HEMI